MINSLQVSCVQMHWAKSLDFNLQRTLHYIQSAAESGSRVVLFPEANLTGYYFPTVIELDPNAVLASLEKVCAAARENDIWVIVGTIRENAGSISEPGPCHQPAGRDCARICQGEHGRK